MPVGRSPTHSRISSLPYTIQDPEVNIKHIRKLVPECVPVCYLWLGQISHMITGSSMYIVKVADDTNPCLDTNPRLSKSKAPIQLKCTNRDCICSVVWAGAETPMMEQR